MPNVCVCMCVYVYEARTLCYARCVPISLVGSSRNQVAGRRREGEKEEVYTDAVRLLSKLSRRAQSIQRTDPRASKHRVPLSFLLSTFLSLFDEQFYTFDSAFPPSVSNLDTLFPEIPPLWYHRELLAREFHRRSDRFRG